MSKYLQQSNQVFWKESDLMAHDVPGDTKSFLCRVGLPASIRHVSFEFQALASSSELMIGRDFEFPIVVRSDGRVYLKGPDGDRLLNSAVDLLAECLCKYCHLINSAVRGPELRRQFIETKYAFERIDEAAMAEAQKVVWPVVLEDFETLALES